MPSEKQQQIPVYFMPGMAANPSIFEYIQLPEEKFATYFLEWKLPKKNETLVAYAKRMCQNIKHKNPVLVGVSFGGVLVQEMAKLLPVSRLVIISSVKTKNELPSRMKFARNSSLYKVFPTGLIDYLSRIKKLPVGNFVKKRVELYEQYLSVNDKSYLDWAIKNMVCWNQEKCDSDLIHIHGDADMVFPIKHIENCYVITGGTHIMILNKYRWFNKHLPELILKGKIEHQQKNNRYYV
ncbi:MAG: alpha/beta hydrolase [Bacteroidota bacterium]